MFEITVTFINDKGQEQTLKDKFIGSFVACAHYVEAIYPTHTSVQIRGTEKC